MSRVYGPHDRSTAPQMVVVGAGSNEHPAPLHPALVKQREVINGLAHNGTAPRTVVPDDEWATFKAAVLAAADADGVVSQTRVRPLITTIPHKHRGLLYRRARREGLLVQVGCEDSTDTAGRNTDKPQRLYRIGDAA